MSKFNGHNAEYWYEQYQIQLQRAQDAEHERDDCRRQFDQMNDYTYTPGDE